MKTFDLALRPASVSAGVVPTGISFLKRAWLMMQIASERRGLQSVSPQMLRDMGISTDEAAREASRPLWDIPASRVQH